MRDHFKFKIYHKSLKKSFFVTSIDYKNNIVCYENGDKTLEVSFENIIMLMPQEFMIQKIMKFMKVM